MQDHHCAHAHAHTRVVYAPAVCARTHYLVPPQPPPPLAHSWPQQVKPQQVKQGRGATTMACRTSYSCRTYITSLRRGRRRGLAI